MPFLKSARQKLLEKELEESLSRNNGITDSLAEADLKRSAILLGLEEDDASSLLSDRFKKEFQSIQRGMESTFVMTDDDVAAIEQLKLKYNVSLTLRGTADLFRTIYLLETKGELPATVVVDMILAPNELCYHTINTTWCQTRVSTHGYSGASVSFPSGLKGVRFRFGGYTPMKTEQMTALSKGTIYVTSKRLLFNGEARNTSIPLNKIVGGHVFSDSVRIEKSAGKPDLFAMNAPEARYVCH